MVTFLRRFAAGLLGLAMVLLAIAPPALADQGSWEAAFEKVDYGGLPRSVLERRPDWAGSPVLVDNHVVWVVAILPPSLRTWNDRLLLGSRQAE
ncbi:MAG: hypothetical protein KGR26_15550, partial [Cyanobacteria bacterium REEB65]|nr:hypothetical protein [Cyanobacteria bacterium REEB65]